MTTEEIVLKGISICRGIAVGKPVFFSTKDQDIPSFTISHQQIEGEIRRLYEAIEASSVEINNIKKRLVKEKAKDAIAILETQLQILKDRSFLSKIEEEIRSGYKNAEAALKIVLVQYEFQFSKIENPFFRDRFKDLQDVGRRIMAQLQTTIRASLANMPPSSIVFSREISASDTAEANIELVAGFVTESGGVNSHAAIIAKSRGTPYVSNIGYNETEFSRHSLAIVDGRSGSIILSPNQTTVKKYQNLNEQLNEHLKKLEQISCCHSETLDGYKIRLSANIEGMAEVDTLHRNGGDGVGLYRSEFLIFNENQFPSEEEQFRIYLKLVQQLRGLPVVIRTFDVGGDKKIPGLENFSKYDSSLGCRAIRFLLKERSIFHIQLRAILRASAYGDVSILFPLISHLAELREAKNAVLQVKRELEKDKVPVGPLRIGVMIEVPSAAMIADLLANECDFISIGTNDLIQYSMAIDRNDYKMNDLSSPAHPSILRLLKTITEAALNRQVPVSICGEVAADPRFTPIFLGLGVKELSVAARFIPAIKHVIRSMTIVNACRLTETAMKLKTAEEIQDLLEYEYRRIVPEDYIYNVEG